MMEFILATTNKNKLSEINNIAIDYGINFKLPNSDFEVIEDGNTLYENALKKARCLSIQNNNCYILSDDTGLFVDALNGAPGIHSARYETTAQKRIQKLLNALKNEENRKAKFICSMVLLAPKGNILFKSQGEIEGYITTSTEGINGFGYDPIFFIKNLNKTMAQLSFQEKNTVSHRAIALIPILEFIKTHIL